MGSHKAYDKLLEDRKAVEEKMNELVSAKLFSLRQIGHDTLQKKLGYDWRNQDLSYLGDLELWFKSLAKVTNITEQDIVFATVVSKNLYSTTFKLKREILYMSDRAMAKFIRGLIYGRKEFLMQEKLRNEASEIAAAENSIRNKNAEIIKLQNKLDKDKVSLTERTLASQAAFAK